MSKINTKLFMKFLLLAATVFSLFFIPWSLIKAKLAPLPNTIQEQVDKSTNYGFDGIIVYVEQAGKPSEFYSAGKKNSENNIPADPHSLFKIASNDKLYTAVAITKLTNEGFLSLDKTLADYFPEFVGRIENSGKITVRMLVQHRSGIPNFTDTHNYWINPKKSNEERLKLVLDLPANFEPDKDYEYCNTNYLLLSELIEKVTNKSQFQYIKENILSPLNLKKTFESIDSTNLDDVMSGYYVGYDLDLKSVNNGSMLATSEDLGKFIRALNDGTVFKDEKEQEIYSSIYKYEHTGLIPGYQSIAKYHKDIDAVVIQFTNTVDFEGYNWTLSEIMYNRIVKIIRNKN